MAFSEHKYGFRKLTPGQKEDVLADLKTLVKERGTWDNVTMSDFDTICRVNGLDYDYLDTLFNLAKKACKGNLDEDNIISKTGSDGETSFEAVPEDVARQLDGSTVVDRQGNKTSVKDTGKKTLGEVEGPGKATLNQQDILNLAKDLEVCTKEALRATGSEVAYTQVFFNKAKATLTVKAYFQQNADNPGKPEGQEFPYKLAEGKVVLEHGETVTNIAAIETQSGTANINRDIATDSIKKVLNREEAVATGEAGTTEPGADVDGRPMLESFSKAVDAYRKTRSKNTIKELFRSAIMFPGDDIEHKFANAVQAYKDQQNVPALEPEPGTEECPECSSDCDIKLTESLFIRLLEFAKEDAKDDVDIHMVAENVSRICMEQGCATIDDYAAILGDLAKEDPEDFPKDQEGKPVTKGEEPEQLQEAGTDIVSKLVGKINDRPEPDYMVYIETKEDEGGYVERKPSDQNMSKADLIDFLQKNQSNIETCYMPGKGTVVVQLKSTEMLQEREEDERERWEEDEPKIPEDIIFYFDPESKKVWEDGEFTAEPGKEYITGTISCIATGTEDQSFSHEFGTERIEVPVCTEVDIKIEGFWENDDLYDSKQDQEEAEHSLTSDDWKAIESWGKHWMTETMGL